jgi:hypothetical protein
LLIHSVAQGMTWVQPSAALLGMALASAALLRARTCPWVLSLACWAALALCVAMNLLPAPSGILLAGALAAAVGAHRLPAGLAWALFAWLVSLAAGWTLVHAAGSTARLIPEVICHTAAALALWWMLAALLIRYWSDRWAGDARAAFVMTAATMAVLSLVLLTCSTATVAIWRLNLWGWEVRPVYMPVVAWQGLIDIVLLIGALLVFRSVQSWSGSPVAMLWLVIFAGTWYSLRLPLASSLTYSSWPEWAGAGLAIQTVLSLSLLGAVVAWVWSDWRVQARAWPGHLEGLVRVSKPSPGLAASATAIGLVLLPAGLWHAFSTGAGAVQAARLTTWGMAAAALALSIFIAWRWNRALAELSLSLWTVSLAAFGTTTAMQVAAPRPTSIEELPVIQSGALFGLTVASFLWFWLPSVWRQQLCSGRAWTTTGRLIPLADRVGFMAAALAVLVGAKLAVWPRLQHGAADNSMARLWVVSLIFLLLQATCLYGAHHTRRPTLLWLAGLAGLVWCLFIGLRW